MRGVSPPSLNENEDEKHIFRSGASYEKVRSKSENRGKESSSMQSAPLEKDAPVENALREVSKIRNTVTDAVEERVRSATQAIRNGRHAAEDAIEEARHAVKQRPFEAVGLAFAAGVLAGGFFTWIGLRRR